MQNNIQPSAHQQDTASSETVSKPTEPLTLREKFAEHFTDTVVSTDSTYSSPNLSVEVTQHTQGRGNDTVTYYVADVYMADLSSFQTEFAGGQYDTNGQREHLDIMSQRVGAILAMNGDSYCFNRSHCNGLLVRNGTVYRNNPTTQDICMLYQDGTMATYGPNQFDPQAALERGILQTWIFGPRLLDNSGKALKTFDTWDYIKKIHSRTALGYYDPGHYCFVVAGQPLMKYQPRERHGDNVVVRPQTQAPDLINILPPGRYHEDGNVGLLTQPPADRKAVMPGSIRSSRIRSKSPWGPRSSPVLPSEAIST